MKLPQRAVITRGIQALGLETEAAGLFARLYQKDYGNTPEDDIPLNEEGWATEERVMGSYEVKGHTVWIILDAGHEVITALLPEEY